MRFDFIIVGGGAAGLSLLYRLLTEPELSQKQVLVLDKVPKNRNDRTWCFWTDTELPFEPIIYRSWQQIRVVSENMEQTFPLDRLRYKMIRGIDFYEEVQQKARHFPNVTFRQAEVAAVSSDTEKATVTLRSGETYTADWVFDSRFQLSTLQKDASAITLLQHFKGWVIQTPEPAFDPERITMFDFRTPQPDGLYFFYTLPFSPHRALVEYTAFSPQLLPTPEAYTEPLAAYIRERLSISAFHVEEEEYGVIPMSNYRFVRYPSPRVLRIGVAGGRAKPSTGYAFLRTQRDADHIVRSLRDTGAPPKSWDEKPRFWVYDTLLLDILQRDGSNVKPLFEQLFRNNPIERLLLFLDERTSFADDIQVMASVRPWPFLYALRNLAIRQRLK